MRKSLFGFILLLTGCFFPAERGHLLEERVQQLTRENEVLSLEVKESQGRVSKALDQTEQWARQSGADIGVQMQRSAEEIAQLRGNVDLLEHRIRELETVQAAHAQSLAAAASATGTAEGTAAGTATGTAAGTAATASTLATTSSAATAAASKQAAKPDEPKAFLKHTEEVLQKKELEEARALLNEFLRRWPKDSAAGEVYFKLGETYFAQKHYREALYEYGKVIQEFPKTASAPLTYLRSSECFRQLKKLPESKLALQELVRLYPKSTEAKKAAELLKSLEESEKKEKEKKTGKPRK
jgi:tol-pal system protein YbgF